MFQLTVSVFLQNHMKSEIVVGNQASSKNSVLLFQLATIANKILKCICNLEQS